MEKTAMTRNQFDFDEEKLSKRKSLISSDGWNYPYAFDKQQTVKQILEQVASLEKNDKAIDIRVAIAGRIWAQRNMGKVAFLDLKDETGKVQVYLNSTNLGKESWQMISKLDLGDIIGIEGNMFRTKRGELSVNTTTFTLLAKTVVPIPIGKETTEKTYNRLADEHTKYKERYLHWMLDDTDRKKIIQRGKIISAIRAWMLNEGFLEVATPTIEFIYGGAEARPFKTTIWALGNKTAYLRISPELHLKRYLIAGFPKVFTICQNFRNEGIDHKHNPEFTMMEWYEAYTDYNRQMVRFENLVSTVCQNLHGTTKISFQSTKIDFKTPWKRLSMLEALKQFENINAAQMSLDELKAEMIKQKIEVPADITWGTAIVKLFEARCEQKLVQPTFITDHPKEVSPLTKVKRGDNRLVERFEPFACGMEIGNAYSELNDPLVQLERFIEQKENKKNSLPLKSEQDYANNPIDADFIKAIGCGMPPAGGVGIGIDRIIMLLTNTSSIRDIVPFPMVAQKKQH